MAGSPWIGAVWSFKVANFLVIDLSQKTLNYDNTLSPFFSELAYTTVPADWTSHGETALSLRFQGATGPAATGSTTVDGPGAYTLKGAGSDIWNNSDQFQYAYMTLTGDGSITAKVESCEQKDVWSKGGVMIRQSAAADSTYVIEAYNAGGSGTAGGTCFQWRATKAGGAAAGANGPGLDAPVWVRLVRTGDMFTGFTSTDGQTWTQQGDPLTLAMTDPVLVGLEYTSHVNATTFGTAVFTNVSTTGNVDATSANNVDVGLGNSAQPIYVAVQDAAGKVAVVDFGNSAATMLTDWTSWEIPLGAFVGVDLANVAKLSVGVGNSLTPAADGTGVVNIDSVRVVSAVDVTQPGDEVHGIPESDVCGGDSSVNVSPCAELPANVIDNNPNTKYLNFKGNFNAGETACGFTVVPSAGATVVTGMTFTSANDSPERDPTAFELDGSNNAGATWTLIASGPIVDFAGAVAWPRLTKTVTAISFANDAAYTEYKVLFTALRNTASANSMQVAEVELLGSVSVAPPKPTVKNLLANGGFETGVIAPYGTYGSCTTEVVTTLVDAAVAEGPVEGKYALHVVVPAAGVNNWDDGMTDGSFTWQAGKKYTFCAFVKCKSGTLQFRMKPEHGGGNYEGYGDQVFTATDTWQEFHVTTPVFTADVTPASPTFHFAFAPGDFWMDNIRLYEGEYVAP